LAVDSFNLKQPLLHNHIKVKEYFYSGGSTNPFSEVISPSTSPVKPSRDYLRAARIVKGGDRAGFAIFMEIIQQIAVSVHAVIVLFYRHVLFRLPDIRLKLVYVVQA
jgi:hypothetical protein